LGVQINFLLSGISDFASSAANRQVSTAIGSDKWLKVIEYGEDHYIMIE